MKRNQIYRIIVTAATIIGMAAGLLGVRPVAASRAFGPISISTCRAFTAAHVYMLTKSVGKSGNCMVIEASNVVLNLNGFSLVGNGKFGHGVIILHGLTGVQVLNGQIRAWGTGVEDLGTGTRLQKLRIFNNTQFGVFLSGATNSMVLNNSFPGNESVSLYANGTTGATVSNNSITGSGRYGVWVRESSHFTVASNGVSQSGIVGIFVGCTKNGITKTLCGQPSTAGIITGNRIVLSTHLGIAIDTGNTHIHVSNNNVSLSGTFDLVDANPGCGTNTWAGDTFKTHNKACAA